MTNDVSNYHPAELLDAIIHMMALKNDAALCRHIGVPPPVISKIRHGRVVVGAAILIRLHEMTDLSIKELRALMGDRRERFSLSPRPTTAL